MQWGDLFQSFIDHSASKLALKVNEIQLSSLKQHFEISIKNSVVGKDAICENVTCSLSPQSLHVQLLCIHSPGSIQSDTIVPLDTQAVLQHQHQQQQQLQPLTGSPPFVTLALTFEGFESLCIDFTPDWPMSLIFTKSIITKYQLVFRFLWHCRYTESLLLNCWQSQQQLMHLAIPQAYLKACLLRHKMVQFIQNLTNFLGTDVLSTTCQSFERKFLKVRGLSQKIIRCFRPIVWMS